MTAPLHLYEFPSNPTGPLVNLAYANGFLPQTYTRALQPLFARYRVVSAHLRPMWNPPHPPELLMHWRQLGDDLLQQLAQLTSDPVIAVGHSVGSVASLYAAVKVPPRFSHLILLDPSFVASPYLWISRAVRAMGGDARIPLVQQALRRGRSWASLEDAYRYFRAKPLFTRWSDEQVRAYAESITGPAESGGVRLIYPPEWEAQIYRTMATDVWSLPKHIRCPILVVRGELTHVFSRSSAARFQRLAPQTRVVNVPGAGHLVAQEAPEVCGNAMAEFLASS